MGLRAKFNLAIIAVFLVGFAITALLLKSNFEASARTEAIQNGRVMLAAADGIRHYTTSTIVPLIGAERDGKFLPASVPSFAAQTNFRAVSSEFVGYRYKEAALNPTNLSDRATDWEADIINEFRQSSDHKEIVTERDTPLGQVIDLARPIRIKDPACMVCHSQPSVAPVSMTNIYGSANGFGWKMDDVIGAQILSLPLALPLEKARKTLWIFLGALTGVFLLMLAILNLLLHYLVVQPVKTMARIATEVSLGNTSIEMFQPKGKDEISSLSEAFNRMRRSLESALGMLEEEGGASAS